jgi:predicted ribosomally synthesized peptide with SipW-like signal peptide
MKTRMLAIACGLAASAVGTSAAFAETVVVNDQVTVKQSSVDGPKRGITMTQVEARFGAPVTKHATVGEPPITRWDYTGFAVFFERDRVIDTVVTGG